jgi:hypothetical protein
MPVAGNGPALALLADIARIQGSDLVLEDVTTDETVDVLRHLTPTGYRSATWAAGCLTVRFPQAVAS